MTAMTAFARAAVLVLLAAAAAASASDAPAPAHQMPPAEKSAPAPSADASKSEDSKNQANGPSNKVYDHARGYTHVSAGFRFTIPPYYRGLDQATEQPRIAQGLAPLFITGPAVIGRAAMRNFRGLGDPKQPEKPAPEFRVASGGTLEAFDAGKLDAYRAIVEGHLKTMGVGFEDLDVAMRDVADGRALRIAYRISSGLEAGDRFLAYVVPGKDRSFEIDFAGPQGEDGADVKLVLTTFEFLQKPAPQPQPEEKRISPWPRVAWWTGGCFAAGVLAHLLYRLVRRLARGKTKAA